MKQIALLGTENDQSQENLSMQKKKKTTTKERSATVFLKTSKGNGGQETFHKQRWFRSFFMNHINQKHLEESAQNYTC